MHAILLRSPTTTTTTLLRSLSGIVARPAPSRSASVLVTSTAPATPARSSKSGTSNIHIESSSHINAIVQELVGFPLASPPAPRPTVPTTGPKQKRSSTCLSARLPLVDQWFEHLSGVWPHILAPPAVSATDGATALKDLHNAIEQGSSSAALHLARSCVSLARVPAQLRPRFAAIIASCPLVSDDHHAHWDTLVAESVQAACDMVHDSTSTTAITIQTQLVAHLARAVGKRQLVSHLSHMDQLLRAFHLHLDVNQLEGAKLKLLHDSLVFMYLRLGQPDRAVHYIEGFVPTALRSEEMVQFLELARKQVTKSQPPSGDRKQR